MKLYSITLAGLLLGSSAIFAGNTYKETAPTNNNANTAKFIGYSAFAQAKEATPATNNVDTAKCVGYSALALANAAIALVATYVIADETIEGKLDSTSCLAGIYLIPVHAFLAKSDATKGWHYYQKAFSPNNKIESTSTCPSNGTEVSTKKVHAAKLIGYSGFALTNLAATAISAWLGKKTLEYDDDTYAILAFLAICGQASSRLAVSNFYSILEHYRKTFPPKGIKKTAHEGA